MLLTSDIAVTCIRNDVTSLQKEIQPISNLPNVAEILHNLMQTILDKPFSFLIGWNSTVP